MTKPSLELFRNLFPKGIERRYEKNQIICYEGDIPNSVYFILKGHVKYYDIDEDGNEKIIHINSTQNLFPMTVAFSVSESVEGFYSAIDDCLMLVVPINEFKQVVATNIELSNALNKLFILDSQEMANRISAMEKTDAKSKILYSLKSLSNYYSEQNDLWLSINFPVTRQFMAEYTGLARETVSITMTELEKDGVIRTGKQRSLEIKATALPKN